MKTLILNSPVRAGLSLLLLISLFSKLPARQNDSIPGQERVMQLHLDAVEVLGLRPLQESKIRSPLRSMELMSHDAGAILTRLPALNGIRKGGGYGFDPVLRGFKYDQLGVLIDGIQTSTVACPNRMDPPTSQVAVNALSSIELHKGPYSLRYGNHVGGVLNFISAAAAEPGRNGIYSRVSGGYETNGSVMRTEALAGYAGERGQYQLAGSWHKGSDYEDGDGGEVPASFSRANLGLSATYFLNERQQLSARLTRNFARNADYPALPMDLRSDDTWLLHLSHHATLKGDKNQHLNTSVYASLVDHLMDNLDKMMEPRTLNASTAVKTRNFGLRSELGHIEENSTIYAGIDVKFEGAEGYRTREFLMGPMAGNILTDNVWQNGRILKSGVFTEYEKRLKRFRYRLSGRLNVNSAAAPDTDPDFAALYHETSSTQLNPGISGGMEYNGDFYSVALWSGRVQRSGSLSERFMNSFPVGLDPYELIGNPGLKPEVNNQADLIMALFHQSTTRLEVDLFYSYLRHFISSTIRPELLPRMPSAPGVRQYANIDKARIAGFEFSFTQGLPLNMHLNADLAMALGKNLTSGEALAEIAPMDLRLALTGSYFRDNLGVGIYFRNVWEQQRISAEFGETATPGFNLLDLDLSFRPVNFLLISTGVRNLFDIAYYEHLNRSVRGTPDPIYDPGRNFYVGLSMEF